MRQKIFRRIVIAFVAANTLTLTGCPPPHGNIKISLPRIVYSYTYAYPPVIYYDPWHYTPGYGWPFQYRYCHGWWYCY